jgi:hypothetical protein
LRAASPESKLESKRGLTVKGALVLSCGGRGHFFRSQLHHEGPSPALFPIGRPQIFQRTRDFSAPQRPTCAGPRAASALHSLAIYSPAAIYLSSSLLTFYRVGKSGIPPLSSSHRLGFHALVSGGRAGGRPASAPVVR